MEKHLKIFVAIYENFAHEAENPFVSSLEDAITTVHLEVEFCSEKDKFWTRDDWDIVHVMWPDSFVPAMNAGNDLYQRLNFLKQRGTIIVSTIHNLWSHSHSNEEVYYLAYNIAYSLSDVMIHLGTYSKNIFEKLYPNIQHTIIPHHVYDTIYTSIPTKSAALEHLGYKEGLYVLVFGVFRHIEEKQLLFKLLKSNPQIKFIIPRLFVIPDGRINLRWLKQRLKYIYYKIKFPNLYCSGKDFVSDKELPYYYAASDISFVARMVNLNSGNLPLGMLMGHVIVGPNTGNVGEILRDTYNYVYDFHNLDSINAALNKAVSAVAENKGAQNKEYALKHWSTNIISENHYQLYKSLCHNH